MSAHPAIDARSRALPLAGLQQILDATSAVVAVKDLDGRYLYFNDAFMALLGGVPSDYIGRTDDEIFEPELARHLRGNDRQVLEARQEHVFEERIRVRGAIYLFQVRKYPLVDAEGQPWGLCLHAEDITRRKRTDDALRSIALGISAATGPAVFELTVRSLAQALDVDYAFVAALDGAGQGSELTTLAAVHRTALQTPTRYAVRGTPCACVLSDGFQYYSGAVQEQFPHDAELAAMGFRSYAGHQLLNAEGLPVGVLSVCHRGLLPDPELVETMLCIFSVRCAAELERERMDRELRLSEESYRTIFETAEDCIFVHDIDTGAFVDVNPKACEVYGYDHATLLSKRPGDLSTGEPPFTEDDAREWLERARAGAVVRFEWHRRNADGSAHWDEVCLKRVRLAGVDRILAVTRDVTDRMLREQALARSEDRLRATVTAALDCIITMDSGGRILDFNPAAESCFGYASSAVRGRSLAELLVPPRFRQAHRDGLERYLRDGSRNMIGRRSEIVAMCADGSEIPVELTIGVAHDGEGQVFIGYMRDLRAQREAEQARSQLEAQLRQAQKMEAIGHLAGGIAHDFNNILTGIMGYLVLAEERATASADVMLLRYVERARHAGGRAGQLIQQMLTFSRGRSGNPRLLSLAAVVRDGLRLVRASLPATVVLEVDLDDDLPPARLDPVQMEQVLLNLCINARDAMAGTGQLRLKVSLATFETAACASCQQACSGRYLELLVADSGPGVPEAVMGRMFEPFFSTKGASRGSGMGLATVHGIVHDHAGHVLVHNLPEGGACFRVVLPAMDDATPEALDLETPDGAAGRSHAVLAGRVLLVEDDPTAHELMLDLLQSWGLAVVSYTAPLAALSALEARPQPFDVAILDHSMPEMTGLLLASKLRALYPDLPMLLYTGYAEGLDDERLSAAGIETLLRKPLDIPALFEQLQRLLA